MAEAGIRLIDPQPVKELRRWMVPYLNTADFTMDDIHFKYAAQVLAAERMEPVLSKELQKITRARNAK